VKGTVGKFLFSCRYSTQSFRSLPHFIVIGAQKSGTTSLFYYMSQHPQILPVHKGVHFFDGGLDPNIDTFKKGQQWYRAHFPLRISLGADRITGEVSPRYIFNPLAAQRLYNLVPKAKLIAILRNPTERAISHYFFSKGKGREPLPIMEALEKEDERLAEAKKKNDFKSNSFAFFSYKSRGLYGEQIERFLRFFPRHQLLVLSSEEFFTRTADTLKTFFGFLEIDENIKISNLTPKNVSTNKTKVAPEVYQYLDDFFSSPNQALYQLLGKKFDW